MMPPRVARIKAAIEDRLDFSTLADGGEEAVAEYGRSIGVNGRAMICAWQQNYQQAVVAEGGRGKKKPPTAKSREGVSEPKRAVVMRSEDLDFWASDDAPPADDEGGDEVCPACNGRGKDAAGNECVICGGSGRASTDDEDEEDEEEKEIVRYEYGEG